MNSKTVSVCLAVYNGERYLYDQLKSILSSPVVTELIVSDDGSTDKSKLVISSFCDPRIHLVNGPQKGLIKNFEHALRVCTGDLIFLCDQDDIWLPDKVDRMLVALEYSCLVVSDCIVVNNDLNVIHPSFFKIRSSRRGFFRNLLQCRYLGCCMAFDRKLLNFAIPFPNSTPMHDWWLGLVAEMVGKVTFIQDKLILYRRHENNVSSTAEKSNVSFMQRIIWRVNLIVSCAKLYFRCLKLGSFSRVK